MTGVPPSQPAANQSRLGIWPWVLKLLVSAGLIGYLLTKIKVGGAFDRVISIPALKLLGAFLLVLTQALIGALRWKFVVNAIGGKLSALKAALITFVSLFFNQFLPASVGGDLVRMWQSNQAGLNLPMAVTSVMLERFGNLLCVVAMALAVLPLWTRHVKNEAGHGVFILIALIGSIGLVSLMFLDRLPRPWHRWRIVRGLATLARDTRSLFLHPGNAALLIITTIAGQLLLSSATLLITSGLGLDVRMIDCLVLMPAVVLASSLPISIAGWGVRELAVVSAFGMLGVPAESALALSLVLALTATAVSLPGGIIWAWSRTNR